MSLSVVCLAEDRGSSCPSALGSNLLYTAASDDDQVKPSLSAEAAESHGVRDGFLAAGRETAINDR